MSAESEYDKRVTEHEGKRGKGRSGLNAGTPVKKLWAPSLFLPRPDSFLLGRYNFTPIDIIGFPTIIPPALCASLYDPYSDVIITQTFRKIANGEIIATLQKAEESAKTNLLMLKDSSGFEYNKLQSRIGSLEASKEYLLNRGAFWEFEMKLFTRISEADIKNDIEFDRYVDNTQRIKDLLQGAGFALRKRFMNMKKYVNYLAPIAFKVVNLKGSNDFQPFTTEAINNLFPIVVGSDFGKEGDVYGVDTVTGLPLIIDRFHQESYNMVVTGQTGSGKSFFVKMLMLRYRHRDNEAKFYILDPLGEFGDLAVKLHGTVIDMAENIINPLDLRTTVSKDAPKGNIMDKVNRVLTMLNVYFRDMNDQMLTVVSNALTGLYSDKGYDVTFTDLIAAIQAKKDYDDSANAKLVVESLKIFTQGSLENLNHKTNVELKNDLIVFDLSKGMDERMREFFLFFMTDFLYGEISKDFNKKQVLIDEARYFMMHRETASFINNFVVHSRHFNCGVTLITQNIDDFYTEEGSHFSVSTLSNAYSVVVFYNKDVPEKFIKAHGLTDDEVAYILTETGVQPRADGGKVSQCLLIQKHKRYRLVVEGLPLESELITTDPEVLRKRRGW